MSSDDIKSSKGVSVFFGICFIILLIIHVVLMLWKKSWHMLWLIIGTILELSAFFQNSAGHGVQSVQVIIAPIFIAASVYISFSGLLKKLEIPKVGFNRRFQSFLFIIGDIVSFGLQIAGVVLQMIEDNKALGQGLIITGFVVQIVSFCCFVTLVISAHRIVNRTMVQSTMKGYILVGELISRCFMFLQFYSLFEISSDWLNMHRGMVDIFSTMRCLLIYLMLLLC